MTQPAGRGEGRGRRGAGTLKALLRVALLFIATAACGGQVTPAGSAPTPVAVDVRMRDVTFEPTELTVARGVPIEIRYVNDSDYVHNLIIQSADVEGRDFSSPTFVKPGERGTVDAVFRHPGQVKFICSFHVGMAGTITIQ